MQSGRQDLNLRPSDPQSDALAKLRHAPDAVGPLNWAEPAGALISQIGARLTTPAGGWGRFGYDTEVSVSTRELGERLESEGV